MSKEPPVWIRVPEAVRITGLSRSKIYVLLKEDKIRNASFCLPGQHHATRLIDRAALLAFIERHVKDPKDSLPVFSA